MKHPVFDAYSKELGELLTYPASEFASFEVYSYEWIDNLHFLLPPSQVIVDENRRAGLEDEVRRRFLEEGWEGSGNLSLLWLPPFVFPFEAKVPTEGVLVWHVKQHEDGISWLLSPVPLPFDAWENAATTVR
jgi:hypothetical protein